MFLLRDSWGIPATTHTPFFIINIKIKNQFRNLKNTVLLSFFRIYQNICKSLIIVILLGLANLENLHC